MYCLLVSLSFAALVLLAPAAAEQDSDKERLKKEAYKIIKEIDESIERFKLFNACRPMQLLIEPLPDDAEEINLSWETLQAAAESRLRAARLYREAFGQDATLEEHSNAAILSVEIGVVGATSYLGVKFNKRVTDAFGETTSTPTWIAIRYGTHGGNANSIVSALSQQLDEFLAAYLRVNEPACGDAPVQR